MHELSIAVSIVEAVEEELARRNEPGAQAVIVRVGALTGVVPDALEFAWGPATAATRLAGSALRIEVQEAVAFCPACSAERALPSIQAMRCPVCGAPVHQIVRGNELQIVGVELE
jgi:hydrogenase nickel incorporation protein HypA/HybF